MSTTARAVTADELLRMHGDGVRRELIRGEIKMMSPVGHEHCLVVASVASQLMTWATQSKSGRVASGEPGFLMARNPDTVRAPDVAFMRRERYSSGVPIAYFPGAPDLAVEVVSPGDTPREVEEKAQDWLANGAEEVWVVHPRTRTVTIYRSDAGPRVLNDQETLDSPVLLPGFSCAVGAFFDLQA
jgi:Uma2 family endonuclease